MTRKRTLTEATARKVAGRTYWEWYAAQNGRPAPEEATRLRAGSQRWERGTGWTFHVYHGGRPIWVYQRPDGTIAARRQDMPEAVFRIGDITT